MIKFIFVIGQTEYVGQHFHEVSKDSFMNICGLCDPTLPELPSANRYKLISSLNYYYKTVSTS